MKTLTHILFLSLLAACGDPTASIKPYMEKLETEHKNDFKTFKASSRTLQYVALGDETKRPLLLIHGSPGNLKQWAYFLLNPNLQHDFHVIAVDRHGYNGSGKGTTERSVDIQANDIFEVLKINKSGEKPIVVGYSYAGAVAANMAMHKDVAGLLLLSGSADPHINQREFLQYLGSLWVVRDLIPAEFRVSDEESFALNAELFKMEDKWKNIHAKTFILHGDKDPVVSIKNSYFAEKSIPESSLVEMRVVHEGNHYVLWEHPSEVIDAIYVLDESLDK